MNRRSVITSFIALVAVPAISVGSFAYYEHLKSEAVKAHKAVAALIGDIFEKVGPIPIP